MRHSRSLDEWDVVSGGDSSCSDGELVEAATASAAALPASAITSTRGGVASESPVMVEEQVGRMAASATTMVPSATSASPVLVSPPVAVVAGGGSGPPPRVASAPLRPLALQPHPTPAPLVQPSRLIDEEFTFHVGVQLGATSPQHFLSPQVHAAPASQSTETQAWDVVLAPPAIHAAVPTTVVASVAAPVESQPTVASNPTPPFVPTGRPAASSLPPLLHPPPPPLFAGKPPTGYSSRSASNSSADTADSSSSGSGSSDGCSGLLSPPFEKASKLLIRATSTASSSSSSSSLTPSPTLGGAFTFQPDNNNHATVQLLRSHDLEMGVGGSSAKSHSASAMVPPTGGKCANVTPPDPLLFSPSACFCCQLSWRHRVMGFVASFGLAAMLFLLSFFSLGRVLIDTPLAFAICYVAAHAAFMTSCCFLAGPRKSAASLLHSNRALLACIYVGLLLLLLCVGVQSRDSWLMVVPVWLLHLAAASWYCLMYLPLSRAMLIRAMQLAAKPGTHDSTAGCCGVIGSAAAAPMLNACQEDFSVV